MNISLSPLAPENLISRDGFGTPVPRQSANCTIKTEILETENTTRYLDYTALDKNEIEDAGEVAKSRSWSAQQEK